jgi:putative ABC transport system permease protein
MSGGLLLARRNLARNRVRLVVSVGGVALALSLVLALDAVFAGVSNQLTAYVDRSGADVWVSQSGVRNLHMVASSLPDSVTEEVRAVDGVAEVTPIMEATDTIVAQDERAVVYVIGLRADAPMGGPWDVVGGVPTVGRGGVVVDRSFARRAGVGVGDTVTVLGGEEQIVGLSEGTASLVNSVAFISIDDFRARRRGAQIVSFVLVRTAPGASPDGVAESIAHQVPGVTAQSRASFADEERRLVMDMSGDVISIMNAVGFIVGLAVVALTVYVATLARRREYGALKALGAPNRFLYWIVLVQAFLSVVMGFIAGVAVTGLLGLIVPRIGLDLELSITAESLLKVGAVGTVIAGLAAIVPIRGIAGLDPAIVFHRGVST